VIKCIIFDFDGTLADTNEGIVKTFQETFRHLGMPIPSVERVSSTIGLTLKDGFKAAYDNLSEEIADRAADYYRSIFNGIAIPCTKVFPEVCETLAELRRRGYELVIATSRSFKSLGVLSEQIGVKQYFSGFYCAESVERHKPFPDLVNLILKEHGLAPDEVIVVGDATYDLLMGKGAGCKVCGVTWGNQTREKLSTAEPEYLIDRMSDLLGILG